MAGETKSGVWQEREVRSRIDEQRYDEFVRAERERKEREGIYDDETTWMAETLNGSMSSEFTFTLVDDELTASDGRQLRGLFVEGKERAQQLAAEDPSMQGEILRSELEWEEFLLMDYMAHDPDAPNTMVVMSGVLHRLKVNRGGYQVDRGLGWSRIITRDDKTMAITISSQSLDGDYRPGYNAIFARLKHPIPDATMTNDEMLGHRAFLNLTPQEQATLKDELRAVYDSAMDTEFGGSHRAGRLQHGEDTWQFTLKQHDLMAYHMEHVAPLILRKRRGEKNPSLDKWIQHYQYNTAAALRRRYEMGEEWTARFGGNVASETSDAGSDSRANGETFDGCGISLDGQTTTTTQSNAQRQLERLGYSINKKVKGTCPFCKNLVWYDPCAPVCPIAKCPSNKGRAEAAKQKRDAIHRTRMAAAKKRAENKGTKFIDGVEYVTRQKLVVGGTRTVTQNKQTGEEFDD